MKIFVHPAGSSDVREVEASPDARVAALLVELGGDAEALLWVEEAEDPLDPDTTLVEAGIVEFTHVHHGHCKAIAVAVRFGGETKEHEFSPASTVQRVFSWASGNKGFDLPAEQRAKHTLGLCGTQTEADRRDHVGSLASDCRVCFDLAPKARYQG